ncbi:MAG: hypothetical protein ACKOW9_06600 [Candidatus Paceibacterota bacterium]
MRKNIKKDTLTGLRSIHPDLTGKPLPKNTRILPNEIKPCPFCLLAENARLGLPSLSDGSVNRNLIQHNQHSFATTNRWGIFGLDSTELIVPYEHVTDLESMSKDQIISHFELTHKRYLSRSQSERFITFAFINVGLQSGSSIPHLHTQVMNPPFSSNNPLKLAYNADLSKDIIKARKSKLLLSEEKDLISYVAPSPMIAGEVRVISSDINLATINLHKILQSAAKIHTWSYNILINYSIKNPFKPDSSPAYLLHFLPRFDLGSLFQIHISASIQSVNETLYHKTLLDNLPND